MVLSMERWVGKVAIVTGASAGIGAAICEQLVKAGVIVAGFARRKERVEEIAKKLKGAKGKLHAVQVDMTKEKEILAGFQWVEKKLGHVHILVNNAGVAKTTSLMDGDTKMWKDLLDTNVVGLCIATREACRIMTANKIAGHIIHINSVAGHWVLNMPNMNVYPASKHAVTALAQQLRFEFNAAGVKIKITSISPGAVATEIAVAAGSAPEIMEMMKHIPMLKSDEIADSVTYALSTGPDCLIQELIIRPVLEKIQ